MSQFPTYQSGASGTELQKISQSVGSNIQKISQNVKSIKQLVNQLGTDQDNQQLRAQLHQIQHYTGGLAKDTTSELRNFQNASVPPGEDAKAWRMQAERLTREFTAILNDFQSSQREAASKEKEALRKAKAESDAHYFDEKGGSALVDLGGQTNRGNQVQLQMEQEAELEQLEQCESQIRQLESDIVGVNQIFKDLATMVHEQGEYVDSIEANVESAQIQVTHGTSELSRALRHQNKARKKKVILSIIGLVILAIIILIIVISLKS